MRRALVVALALGCAALSAAEGVWLDVPFVRQEANGCGSAALAMILDYWDAPGLPHDAGDIQRQLYDARRKGIAADTMRRFLEAHEFSAFVFSGQWTDLRHHVALGRPLIVALKVGGDNFHYAVVAGATDTTVSLNDPADRKLRLLSRADFEKKWAAAGQWTLLAVPLPKS